MAKPKKRTQYMQETVDDIMRQAHRSTGKELQDLYRKLAKRADQRLVRLEKLAGEENFASVKEYSYRKAMKDLHDRFGENALRFNRSTKGLNRRQLQAAINDVAQFLGSVSSTKTGIIAGYEQRAKSLNDRIGGGADYSWQDFAKMFELSDASGKDKKGGSGTMIRAYGAIYHMKNDPDAVKAANEGTYVFANDPVVDDLAQQLWKALPW